MGVFASVLVAKSVGPPDALAAHRNAEFLLDDSLAAGWHVWAIDDTAFAERHIRSVDAVERTTRAPALVGQLIDSDVILLTGRDGPDVWDLWIPLPADPDMAQGGPLTGLDAAQALTRWATTAGLDPDARALAAVTENEDHDAFGGWTALRAVIAAFGLNPSPPGPA